MIVATLPLWRFPLPALGLSTYIDMVEAVFIRFDAASGDRRLLRDVRLALGKKVGDVFESTTPWDGVAWREECLRMLDSVKPTVVLAPDEDEGYEPEMTMDIARLLGLKTGSLEFKYEYPMPSVDGVQVLERPFPSKPHVKAYCWQPGLTYYPYRNRARLANGGKEHEAMSKMRHFCWHNAELREAWAAGRWEQKKARQHVD